MSAGSATARRRAGWGALALVLAAPFGLAIREDVLARRADAASVESEPPAQESPPAEGMGDEFFAALGGAPQVLAPEVLARFDRLTVRAGERYAAAASLDAGLFLTFPDDGSAERELTRRWGEPLRAVDGHDIARSLWFDREAEIRASLETAEGRAKLELRRYQPFDRLVTELRDELSRGIAGPAPTVVEGEDAGAAQPATEYRDEGYPPAELSDAVTEVRRWRTGDRLDAIEIEVDFIYDPSWGERAVADLTRAYGAPEHDSGGRLLFAGPPRMIVVADRAIGRLSVEIRH